MPQARDEAGNIWETDAQGNPVRLIQPAPVQSAMTIPSNPEQVRQQNRQESRQDIQTSISQQGNVRAGEQLNISRGADARSAQGQQFDQKRALRQEFQRHPATVNYELVVRQYATALQTQNNPTGDQALITAYAKMLDPGSVVREQEFNTVAAGDSSLGQLRARISKELGMDSSGLLRPEVRQRVRNEMQNLTKGYLDAYNQTRQQYGALAGSAGFDPDEVLGPHAAAPFRDVARQYDRRREIERNAMRQDITTGGPNETRLAGGNAATKVQPIPAQMQADYAQWVSQRRGAIDPDEYVSFMDALDKKYNFLGNTEDLAQQRREWAIQANKTVEQGGQLNLRIPAPVMPTNALDRVNASMFNNPFGAAVLGAPPLAGGMDEVAGGIRSLINGTSYEQERNLANAMRQQVAKENPNATLLGGLIGGIASGAGIAAAAPRAAGLLGTVTGGTAMGAASGALENNENRLAGAGIGAGAGLVGGAAGKHLLPPLADSMRRTASGINPRIDAPRRLTEAERAMDLDKVAGARQVMQDAQDLNFPLTLSDLNRGTRGLGGSAARFSEDATNLADDVFTRRQASRADRLGGFIEDRMAPSVDVGDMASKIRSAGYQASSPQYAAVFSRPAPVSPEIDTILQTRDGRQALDRAYRIAENEGIDPRSIGFDMNDQGEVTLVSAPSIQTLDMVKRGLDDIINAGRNPVTGKLDTTGQPGLRSVETLRKRLVGELDRIEPQYREARATYEEYARQAEALERGFALGGKDIPERDMQKAMDGLRTDAEREYFRQGYATRLQDRVRSTADQSDPYRSFVDRDSYRGNMGLLFPDAMEDLTKLRGLETRAQRTSQEILGGSQTQPRNIADQRFSRDSAGQLLTDAAIDVGTGSGGVATALGRTRGLLQNLNDRRLVASERRAADMAPTLYNDNPAQNAQWINDLEAALEEQRKRRAVQQPRYGLIGSLVGAGAANSLLPY